MELSNEYINYITLLKENINLNVKKTIFNNGKIYNDYIFFSDDLYDSLLSQTIISLKSKLNNTTINKIIINDVEKLLASQISKHFDDEIIKIERTKLLRNITNELIITDSIKNDDITSVLYKNLFIVLESDKYLLQEFINEVSSLFYYSIMGIYKDLIKNDYICTNDASYNNMYDTVIKIVKILSDTLTELLFIFFNLKNSYKGSILYDNLLYKIRCRIFSVDTYFLIFKIKSYIMIDSYNQYKEKLIQLSDISTADLNINPYFSQDKIFQNYIYQYLKLTNEEKFKLKLDSRSNYYLNSNRGTSLTDYKKKDSSVVSEINNSNEVREVNSCQSHKIQNFRKRSSMAKNPYLSNESMTVESKSRLTLGKKGMENKLMTAKFNNICNIKSTQTSIIYLKPILKLKENYAFEAINSKINIFKDVKQLILDEAIIFWKFADKNSIIKSLVNDRLSFNTDISLLLMCYVLLKSKIPEIYIDFHILSDLITDNMKIDEDGLLIINILSSIELIINYLNDFYCEMNKKEYVLCLEKEKKIMFKIYKKNLQM